jgi:hypothetical protein
MTQVTEKQAAYIRSLVARIEARKVAAPKKVSRWNDPIKAHQQHVAKARNVLALLDAGQLTSAAASTHISMLANWIG